MTPSNVLGVLLAGTAVVAFCAAVVVLFANAHGSVTAPDQVNLVPVVILGLASAGFAWASWWSFTS